MNNPESSLIEDPEQARKLAEVEDPYREHARKNKDNQRVSEAMINDGKITAEKILVMDDLTKEMGEAGVNNMIKERVEKRIRSLRGKLLVMSPEMGGNFGEITKRSIKEMGRPGGVALFEPGSEMGRELLAKQERSFLAYELAWKRLHSDKK